MNTILLVVIQISVSTSISIPNIVATVHCKQESANVLSCMKETFNHYAIRKEISDKNDGKSLVKMCHLNSNHNNDI